MIATRRLLVAGMLLAFAGLVVGLLGAGYILWVIIACALVVAAVVDAIAVRRRPAPKMERIVNHSLPLGVDGEVELVVTMPDQKGASLEIFDGVPPEMECTDESIDATVGPAKKLRANYRIHPRRRGVFCFDEAYVRLRGPLGLMARQLRIGDEEQEVRVVPNFRAVSRYALMAVADKMGQIGVRHLRRRGAGMEFDCLREYREGDQLRQIDWKATAKHRRVIARQYEDERNQQIVLVFDCGRRMRARDASDELSHFDHALNAGLLLSYVALNQGDSVATATFGGVDRWIPVQRGPRAVENIVDQTFDLETTMEPSDFAEAARRLAHRQKRRALVIFLTNLYDAESDELEQALALLEQRHLVLVASLREEAVTALANRDILDFDSALEVSSTHHFLAHRRELHAQLNKSGGMLLDVSPSELSVGLVNRYLEIKRAGML